MHWNPDTSGDGARALRSGTPERFLEFWLASAPRRIAGVILVFAVVALVAASQVYLNWRQTNVEVPFIGLLGIKLFEWLLWAGLVPLILVVDRRLGFSAGRPVLAVLLHASLFVAWFAILNGIMTALAPLLDADAWRHGFRAHFLVRASQRWPNHLVVYALILATPAALMGLLQRERLRRELSETQLHNIRLQLQPHFLFNALNTIGALVRMGESARAIHAIAGLGDLLRRALSHTETEKVTVTEELDLLERYGEIQRLRFGDHLAIEYAVADECRSALLPSMILQPLVENAIHHGLDPDRIGGVVTITIRRTGDLLDVSVSDNGAGFDPHTDEGGREGLGLSITRRRLRALYGDAQRFAIASDASGFNVEFSFPFEQ